MDEPEQDSGHERSSTEQLTEDGPEQVNGTGTGTPGESRVDKYGFTGGAQKYSSDTLPTDSTVEVLLAKLMSIMDSPSHPTDVHRG